MIHDHIHHNTDPVGMGCVYKFRKFCRSTHVFIHLGIIQCPISMIGIIRETASLTCLSIVSFLITRRKSVNLFIWCRDPDGIHTQFIKVTFIDFLRNTSNISTMECTWIAVIVISLYPHLLTATWGQTSSIRMVIAFVYIEKTVGQYKINRCVIPGKNAFFLICCCCTGYGRGRICICRQLVPVDPSKRHTCGQ